MRIRNTSPNWRKSSYSDTSGSACVELAGLGDAVGVRDSKNPEGGFLVLRKAVLRNFAERARNL